MKPITDMENSKYLWIAFLIPFLTLADIGLTVVNVQMYQQEYPQLEYEDIEANRFATWGWRQFGFWNGTYIVGGVILAFVCFLCYLLKTERLHLIFGGALLGAYVVTLHQHVHLLLGWFL